MLKTLSLGKLQVPEWLSWVKNTNLLVLYFASFVFGITAIAHENNLAATASLISGDSITNYAIIIGLTLGGIGFGFWLSSFVSDTKMYNVFVNSEIALTIISGLSTILAFQSYVSLPDYYMIVVWLISFSISTLVGIEDALILRIATKYETAYQNSIGYAFFFSNTGGAVAGLFFGTWLVPQFGVFNLALVLGIVDALIVFLVIWHFRNQLTHYAKKMFFILVVLISLIVTYMFGNKLYISMSQPLYEDPIKHEWITPYGQKVITQNPHTGTFKLFINGQIQFSSKDSAQYHELIVHPAMSLALERVKTRQLNVLVAGGGDGLVVAELLKYSEVGTVVLMDLDPGMTREVAMTEPLVTLNKNSLSDPRVSVMNIDAYIGVRDYQGDPFDVVIVDLVDPSNEATSKLYSYEFYEMVLANLSKGGVMVSQSTSPWYTPRAFWVINLTMEEVFTHVTPYRWSIPSFGDWGWNIASEIPFNQLQIDETKTTWLTTQGWEASRFFGKDEWKVKETLKEKGIITTQIDPAVMTFYNELGAWEGWGEE